MHKIVSSDIAERIKTERRKRKLSQKQLAQRAGVDHTVLSRIENAERDISLKTLSDISQALDVAIEHLLFGAYVGIENNSSDMFIKLTDSFLKLNKEKQNTVVGMLYVLLDEDPSWLESYSQTNEASLENSFNYEHLGQRIRQERIKKKISIEKLSELAGLSIGFVSNIERGEDKPSVETVYKIAFALNVPIGLLFVNSNSYRPNSTLLELLNSSAQMDDVQSRIIVNMVLTLLNNADRWR